LFNNDDIRSVYCLITMMYEIFIVW